MIINSVDGHYSRVVTRARALTSVKKYIYCEKCYKVDWTNLTFAKISRLKGMLLTKKL